MEERLIEAYMGHFEIEREDAIKRILWDSCYKRLEVYTMWNGIIGFTDDLYRIATQATLNTDTILK